jgi:hypothetical protein
MGRIVKMQELNDDLIKNTLNSSFYRWALDNEKICNMILDHKKLILYVGKGEVEVDLRQLPDSFVSKHFTPKPQLFVDELLRKLEQTIFKSLSSIQINDYQLNFTFRYFGIYQSRTVKYYMLTRMI